MGVSVGSLLRNRRYTRKQLVRLGILSGGVRLIDYINLMLC